MTDLHVRYLETKDPALLDELVVLHLPLVKFIASKVRKALPAHVQVDDLIATGSIGLLDAIEKFKPELGFAFSTFAVPRIRGEILDGLQRQEWVPKQLAARSRLVRRAVDVLQVQLGREATLAEIATACELSEAEVRAAFLDDETSRPSSLQFAEDSPVVEPWLASEPEQEVSGISAEIRELVARSCVEFTPREEHILAAYYRDSKALPEIAEELGISKSSATLIHTKLVERIRARLQMIGGAVA